MTDIAYNNAVDQYADGVYRFIVKNIQHEEDARDIVQTAFEKLWINRATVDSENKILFIYYRLSPNDRPYT